jgi:ethanolamine phosphate transferase 2 subunit G
MGTVNCIFKGQCVSQLEHRSDSYLDRHWHLDEVFVLTGIFLYVISLSSSSFVEEEQYTWHFLNSSLYLIFLIKAVHSVLKESNSALAHREERKKIERNEFSYATSYELTPGKRNGFKLCTVLIILVAGRVIRGWHQGGVNWIHFPDISKLLAQADSSIVKSLQIISVLAVVALYSVSLMLLRAGPKCVTGIWLGHISCGLLVLVHIWESQINTSQPVDHGTTSIVQIFYTVSSISITGTALASPWIFPLYSKEAEPASSSGHNSQTAMQSHCISDSVFLTGITYTAFWCLLQLLLQQPNNAIPLLLIFLQTILSIVHFSLDKTLHKQWVQVSFWKYQVFDEDDVFISNLWHHHMNVCLLTNFWQQFV